METMLSSLICQHGMFFQVNVVSVIAYKIHKVGGSDPRISGPSDQTEPITKLGFSIDTSDSNVVKEVGNSVHFLFNAIIGRYVKLNFHQ